MKVNRYQFDSIVDKTKKQILPILRGQEYDRFCEMALIECRMHQLHKSFAIDGRQAKEIIRIVLLDINAAIAGDTWDSSDFEEDCYPACVNEIEKLFFPHKNSELMKQLRTPLEMDGKYFELARKLLVRTYESVELWTKDFAKDGYFDFISGFIRSEIVDNGKYLVEEKYLKG